MKNRTLPGILEAARIGMLLCFVLSPILFTGCVGGAISAGAMGAADATAQTVWGAVVNNNPNDFAAFSAIYPKMFTIASTGFDSYSLGQTVASFKTGATSNGSAALVNALDGAVRNAISTQGGSAAVPSIQQAIAQQAIDIQADGLWHALNIYAGQHGLPKVPQVVPSTATVAAPTS